MRFTSGTMSYPLLFCLKLFFLSSLIKNKKCIFAADELYYDNNSNRKNVMKKIVVFCTALTVSLAMLISSCNREEIIDNNEENNQEEPVLEHYLPDAVVDIDGNSYDAVRLGNQVWMAENLRTTRFADGTTIPLWTYGVAGPACFAPGNGSSNEENTDNVDRYGYLYNWAAVMHGASSSSAVPSGVQGICPTGWHVPSDAEWTELTTYLSSQSQYLCDSNSGNIAKSLAATTDWKSSTNHCAIGNDLNVNNTTDFSALPAGGYFFGTPMQWDFIGNQHFGMCAYFWCATEYTENYPIHRTLGYTEDRVSVSSYYSSGGFSVRCLRD